MKWKGRPENVCESPNEGLEAGGWEGMRMEVGPASSRTQLWTGFAGVGASCPFPPKISLILDLSKISSRTLQWRGSCCREGDGAGLDVCRGVLVCF